MGNGVFTNCLTNMALSKALKTKPKMGQFSTQANFFHSFVEQASCLLTNFS
jgi:hypothetical protein